MMKQLSTLFLVLALCLGVQSLKAQRRYLDDVFPGATVTDNIVYGSNRSVLLMGMPQDLVFDLYEPTSDTATSRPVILLAQTGNFLPRILNGSPFGSLKDSAGVEFANRMAKKGYVVAIFFYRQGWDASNPSQEIQTATLLQAVYRGIQDIRTLVRFFRKNAAAYRIDPDKIIAGGFGTGGYVSAGANFLDDFEEVKLPKFTNFMTGQPYVDTTVHGNIWGTNMATLNIPNHVGFSSKINFAFNVGGALGDSSWIDGGEAPTVSFHTPQDPNAPYDIGTVIVPTTGNTVIDQAAGSLAMARMCNRLGVNDPLKLYTYTDAYTTAANRYNRGYEGLFPFNRPFTPGAIPCGVPGVNLPLTPEGGPWNWWNEAVFIAQWDAATGGMPFPGIVMNCRERAANPDMSIAKGRAYVDSVVGYLTPRMYNTFELWTKTGLFEELKSTTGLKVYPNPMQNELHLASYTVAPMRAVSLTDLSGRELYHAEGLFTSNHTISRGQLSAGVYLVKVRFQQGTVTQKIVVQ